MFLCTGSAVVINWDRNADTRRRGDAKRPPGGDGLVEGHRQSILAVSPPPHAHGGLSHGVLPGGGCRRILSLAEETHAVCTQERIDWNGVCRDSHRRPSLHRRHSLWHDVEASAVEDASGRRLLGGTIPIPRALL